jgi:ankyrin repeat protein
MLTDNEAKLFDLIQANETDKAIELISNGDVRINCLDKNGMNFLDQAAFKGNERLAKLLIEMGADPDNRKHAHRYTSLMFAALSGKPKLCEMLLNAGAQSYVTNNMNKTASEMAAFVGRLSN